MYQLNTLCTLSLHNAAYQLYLNKLGEKKNMHY